MRAQADAKDWNQAIFTLSTWLPVRAMLRLTTERESHMMVCHVDQKERLMNINLTEALRTGI